MKLKKAAWLVSALSLGSCLAVHAHEKQVRQAEESLNTFESKHGQNHQGYTRQLINLAQAYKQNGESDRAQKLFNQALSLDKKKGPSAQIETMVSWARVLSNESRFGRSIKDGDESKSAKLIASSKAKDSKDASELVLRAKELSSKLPVEDSSKYSAQMMLISSKFGESRLVEVNELANQIRKDESLAGSKRAICKLASIMDQLANLSIGKGEDANARAAKLKQEAIQIWNKLPANDFMRINANRRAVKWFRQIGKEDFAKEQTEQLSNLLGTTDPAKLFPPREPCLGCGMG